MKGGRKVVSDYSGRGEETCKGGGKDGRVCTPERKRRKKDSKTKTNGGDKEKGKVPGLAVGELCKGRLQGESMPALSKQPERNNKGNLNGHWEKVYKVKNPNFQGSAPAES